MAKFVTIGYGDRAGYDRSDAAVRDAAHAHDARLRREGVVMIIAGHAFMQNLRRGHYELAVDAPAAQRGRRRVR